MLESSKKGLEEEKELLDRGKREAGAEADKLDQRREVSDENMEKKILYACTSVYYLLLAPAPAPQ